MSGLIEVVPQVYLEGATTVVGFTASAPNRLKYDVRFELEGLPAPSECAVTEASMIASVALAMQRRCVLRVRGKVCRSLRHTIDLYQDACAWWWPHRYQKIAIEVDVVDDQPPNGTRGVLCFSGGVDSIFSARRLVADRQIEAGLLLEGYDIDFGNVEGQKHQRVRVGRLLDRLGLETLAIRTNARDSFGQAVIEGAQGSYLAAALTLLSGRFGRGFVSSGILDLANIGEKDPVHEVAIPLLGSARFPIHVYGGQISRFDKLRELAEIPELFCDIRVCLGRTSDDHCGRCSKCLMNAFACVAINGTWPSWLPLHKLDLRGLSKIRPTEHRCRYAREILDLAAANGESSEWMAALKAWINDTMPDPNAATPVDLRANPQ